MTSKAQTPEQLEGYIAMALHDIDDIRGANREGKAVFREFYRAMQSRIHREIDWGPAVGQEFGALAIRSGEQP